MPSFLIHFGREKREEGGRWKDIVEVAMVEVEGLRNVCGWKRGVDDEGDSTFGDMVCQNAWPERGCCEDRRKLDDLLLNVWITGIEFLPF